MVRFSVTPEVNAISSALLVVSLLLYATVSAFFEDGRPLDELRPRELGREELARDPPARRGQLIGVRQAVGLATPLPAA